MRLVYLCTVDPPPPSTDWTAVYEYLETLPDYLRPRDNSKYRNSPHMCYFADRVGKNWLPEFFDFAIVFISKRFFELLPLEAIA